MEVDKGGVKEGAARQAGGAGGGGQLGQLLHEGHPLEGGVRLTVLGQQPHVLGRVLAALHADMRLSNGILLL